MPPILTRRRFLGASGALGLGLGCMPSWLLAAPAALESDPAEYQDIVRQTWIYAYPMLMHYQTMQKQALDAASPEYVGGFGVFRHYSELFTPKNRDVVTPNNDTPYSWAWLDLRAEPWVLSVPAVADDRYYVHQLVDQYTFNFGYVGVLSTGRAAGDYLIAGPDWQGETPAGIRQVLRSETQIAMVLGRTGLRSADDLPAVRELQQQYRLRALHDFAGRSAPAAAPAVQWLQWELPRDLGAGFIAHLNQILAFCPVDPSEVELRQRFARAGIGAGLPFNPATLGPAQRQSLAAGIQQGVEELKAKGATLRSSAGLFGTRAAMHNDYLSRAAAAASGIYGNSVEEAIYLGSRKDSTQQPLQGGQRYRLRFAPGQLPPAREFWSLTLYDLPDRQLVDNPIQRYCLSSRDPLVHDADGGVTLYIQADSPGQDHQANWLPSTRQGPYNLILRLYGPEQRVVDGQWQMPGIERV
ncbi:lipoprotein [Pseudomonas sp. 21]|uniref:DUF1254 domain-containing protein n=1 Tax=unclassified Pseudomonas TaxID=196821 RepID=UPI0005EBE72B|nr:MULTISPECIES: DUF1254 domain-containing protein [unclassified Pseudomonas]KJK03167.1 lipoprotein [Pseudomonas sp. 21]MBV7584672.1 DUF1254 domain-containing protein [Pseudomonas sp. PDM33]